MDSCSFGANALLTRLAALTAEIDGVRAAKDSEPIHRMRVASRRLRTALTLFADCLPAKRLTQWEKQTKRLTRALGAARDADVQIEFLQESLARVPERRFRPGVQRLLLRMKQRREKLQAKVRRALDKFEASEAANDMIRALTPEAQATAAESPPDFTLYQHAYLALSTRLQELLAFDADVLDPARVAELHQMRIAAKQLRYAMEVFAPLYDLETPTSPDVGLQPYLDIVKTIQEILGDIHDCDVWLTALPEFLAAERARAIDYFGHARALKTLKPGLTYFQQEREYHRNVRYREFADYWQAHQEAGTWRSLLQLITVEANQILVGKRSPTSPDVGQRREMLDSGTDSRTDSGITTLADNPDDTCIALIGDIHANLPALEAVLAHARAQGATAIWNVGDFVGYGPYPDEVVRRLQAEHAVSISGNYDLKMLAVKQKKGKWQKTKRPEKLLAFEWAYDHLSPEARAYLGALPQERRFTCGGKRILLTHASPESNEEPLTAATPAERLRELAGKAGAEVIICGHSHQPFARQIDGVWFINTGSVGRPDDGDPRACYALLQIEPEALTVKHYRVEYDAGQIAAAVRDYGLPESFARIFLYGRSLDDLVVEE